MVGGATAEPEIWEDMVGVAGEGCTSECTWECCGWGCATEDDTAVTIEGTAIVPEVVRTAGTGPEGLGAGEADGDPMCDAGGEATLATFGG